MRSRQGYYVDLKYLSKYFSFKSFYFMFQWHDLLRCFGPPSTLNKQRLHAICLSHRIISWVISWFLFSLKWVFSVRTERIHSKSSLLRVSFLFQCRFPTSWRTLSFSLLFIYRRVSKFVPLTSSLVLGPHLCCWSWHMMTLFFLQDS